MKNSILFLPLIVLILISLISGCNSNSITNPEEKTITYSIPAFDYSESCYIPDTLYKRSFYDYYNSNSGIITQYEDDNRILSSNADFEIWIQCTENDSNKRLASAHTQLYSKPSGGYPDTLKNNSQITGLQYFGNFRKLSASDYYINELPGLIIFKINIPDNYNAGICYTAKNGIVYGKGSSNSGINDTLILKMFKVSNCSPDATPLAWELKLKNIYKIPYTNLTTENFTLDIYFNNNTQYIKTLPGLTTPLITLLKLDRFKSGTLNPPPDSIFDFVPGFTVLPDIGYIIFPDIKPFDSSVLNIGTDTTYRYTDLYTQRKSFAEQSIKANYYYLRGHGE